MYHNPHNKKKHITRVLSHGFDVQAIWYLVRSFVPLSRGQGIEYCREKSLQDTIHVIILNIKNHK